MSYPKPLAKIVSLMQGLPEDDRRDMLIDFAKQVVKYAPEKGAEYDVNENRRDPECTDKVGVYLELLDPRRCAVRMSFGPQVQTLTRAFSYILCRGLAEASPDEIVTLDESFAEKVMGGPLMRQRSQTVYYIVRRIKEAARKLTKEKS